MQHSYSLSELAKFLNRTEKEVQRLADKEILKGRKVQGSWVFSLPDVVLWMEHEMTQVSTTQTEQLENAVSDSSDEPSETISLSAILSPESIDLKFPAKTKSSVLNEIVKLGVDVGKLWDDKAMAEALRERESMSSTALDNGVAILHPRRPQANIIAEDFLALAISSRSIPFGGDRGVETNVFFLLCCQTDESYLRTLGKLARLLKVSGFLDALRECESPYEALDLIEKTENELN